VRRLAIALFALLTATSCGSSEDVVPAQPPETSIEIVRAFLIESVRPELSPVGEWDEEMAEAFQVAVLALQMHPVWGEGCERLFGHRDGVYTQALETHLRSVTDLYSDQEAPQELARVLDAIAELDVVEPNAITLTVSLEDAKLIADAVDGPAAPSGVWDMGLRFREDAATYTVRAGDSLARISHSFYGSARFSSSIYSANRDVLTAIDTPLKVGLILRIPKLLEQPNTAKWPALGQGSSSGELWWKKPK
jgi:hypothetical protein